MAKTKISEFSSTPANNTDIDSINIAEGCAPSNINDAIRELMAQLKDFQTGSQGDSFNGPIGTSTAAAGAFTTVSATGVITSTLATGTAPLTIASTTKVTNLNADLLDGADWASPAALGSTTPAAVSATTLSASGSVTLSGGTANGVTYLNGSKQLVSGSALTFDGTRLRVSGATVSNNYYIQTDGGVQASASIVAQGTLQGYSGAGLFMSYESTYGRIEAYDYGTSAFKNFALAPNGGNVGIGTSSPAAKLDVNGTINSTGIATLQIVKSKSGNTGSVATGVATTLFTLVGDFEESYIVNASIHTADTANYFAVSIVVNSDTARSITALRAVGLLTISLSGANVQATQVSGGNATIYWNATRLS